jgi:hypothetical protein
VSLQDLDGRVPFKQNVLNIWVIYDHPKDYPDEYVARLWQVGPNGETTCKSSVIRTKVVDKLRRIFMKSGLVRMDRSDIDDDCILETWL